MANVKKNLESSNLPALSSFPISQQVTHRYFMGRMAMLETNYAKVCSVSALPGLGGLSGAV